MKNAQTLFINNMEIPIEGERNLLEVIRKAKVELPTFCYHSEISIYGACRLCMVEVEGRGLLPACSTLPEAGLRVRTHTAEIRSMRKIIVELLLANHSSNCPTCPKGADCQLQNLARRLGITKVRFKSQESHYPLDTSSPALQRDPNKCILCGDCVRVCEEIQSVGAIDFAYRGSQAMVLPCFGKNLNNVECVFCGQCSRVCPTGALMPKSNINEVWEALHDPTKLVVAQIAPAVRISIGEDFGLSPGITTTGQIISALRILGFDKIYDTSFTADLTVIEETSEFIKRLEKKERLPQFTSCCPAWVKFVEQYYPEMIPHLSTCRSPQQMFGSLCKEILASKIGIAKKDLVVVSIMPCTAKKFEATRPEFNQDGVPDVDFVITTQELARMIKETGLQFNKLEPDSFDLPFGFKTGAGVIFGNSGGVTEAVLRYASEKISGKKAENYEFTAVRGDKGIREVTATVDGIELKLAVVSGLGNARQLLDSIKSGREHYDLVEVMSCPGGCIGGAGQPIPKDLTLPTRLSRTRGLYENDKMLQLHKSQDNPYLAEIYESLLGFPGSSTAHNLLHTHYNSRQRIKTQDSPEESAIEDKRLEISVCFGTGCFIKGSQKILKELLEYIRVNDLEELVQVKASFCFEKCDRGPVVRVGNEIIEKCTFEKVKDALLRSMLKGSVQ